MGKVYSSCDGTNRFIDDLCAACEAGYSIPEGFWDVKDRITEQVEGSELA
jgi:hypothetical protein